MSEVPVFTSKSLKEPGLSHGFFGRNRGTSSDDAALVRQNQERIALAMGVETGRLAGVQQVHSARAIALAAPWPGAAPRADALVTATTGLGLSIRTADCAPVLLADRAAGVIGAAHAGWRGALGGILQATLAAMEKLGAKRAQTSAVIGPCIAQGSYQVGPEFVQAFAAQDEGAGRFFIPGEGDRHYFDLPGFCAARLTRAGAGTVEILPMDTCALEDDFFSYRRACLRAEPDDGRNISVIALHHS